MPSPRSLTALATSAATLAVSIGAGSSMATAGAAAAWPKPPVALPAAAEVPAPLVKVQSCDNRYKPGVLAFGEFLLAKYPTTHYSMRRACPTDAAPYSEHLETRAIDWAVHEDNPAQFAMANDLINFLLATDSNGNAAANARRMGVMYLIYNNRVWYPSKGWREYRGCSSTPADSLDSYCHRDHIHISFTWAGAMKRTSWWTGQVAATDYGPCREPDMNWAARTTGVPNPKPCVVYPRVSVPSGSTSLQRVLIYNSGMWAGLGSTGPVVRALQQAYGVKVTGTFDSTMVNAVKAFQKDKGLTQTGDMNIPTWRALLTIVRAGGTVTSPVPVDPTPTNPVPVPQDLSPYYGIRLARGSQGPVVEIAQAALGMPLGSIDGSFGPATETVVKAYQTTKKLPVTGVIDTATWKVLDGVSATEPTPPPAATPLAQYYNTVLMRGSRGPDVMVLQRELGFTGTGVDGSFGAATEARLRDFQTQWKLPVTGKTSKVDWVAMETAPNVIPNPTSPPPTTTTPPPTTTPTPVPTGSLANYYGTVLARGATGTAVKILQRELGYPSTAIDGVFGLNTETRLRAFQTMHSLPVTGKTSKADWVAMETAPNTAPFPGAYGKWATTVVRRGSTGAAVSALQTGLKIKVTGTFDAATETALRAFQQVRGLTITGSTSEATWVELGEPGLMKPEGPRKFDFSRLESTKLAYGSRSDAVLALQKALGFEGYLADGNFGYGTRAAVLEYQRKHQIVADGVVTTEMWRSLEVAGVVGPALPVARVA